jgi:hypothetical protein
VTVPDQEDSREDSTPRCSNGLNLFVLKHAQQDRALTQTDRKIETEVAGLKTMLEVHKLDTIKYLAGKMVYI